MEQLYIQLIGDYAQKYALLTSNGIIIHTAKTIPDMWEWCCTNFLASYHAGMIRLVEENTIPLKL